MRLFCFGYGYTASYVAAALYQRGWSIVGTARTPKKAHQMNGFVFDGQDPLSEAGRAALQTATHVLISIPPDEKGMDAAWSYHAQDMHGKWIGYFSTTGVYGDWNGEWVDETSPLKATEPRSICRILAEEHWQCMRASIFRLAGIYGPNRNVLDNIRAGTMQRISKPGHYFSRIHVDDIAQAVVRAIERGVTQEIINLCDDAPSPSHEVIAYGGELLQKKLPPLISFEQAELSPMARSFYEANRLVNNAKMKKLLDMQLLYPSYKEGLASILHREQEFDIVSNHNSQYGKL